MLIGQDRSQTRSPSMHPFTTTPELARTFQAERDAAIRRAMATRPGRRTRRRATTDGDRRGTFRAARLRVTVRFWRLAGRATGQPGRWVFDWRA
jgi:hypothetical protein